MAILVQSRNFFYNPDSYKQNGSDSAASSQLSAKEQEKTNYESSIEGYKSQYSTISIEEESIQSGLTTSLETVSLSETAVLNAETNVESSQEKVTLAQEEVTAAKTVVSDAQTAVTTAENNVSTAQSNVDVANNAVASAQSSLQSAMAIPIKVIKNSDGSITYDSSARDSAIASAMAELNAAQSELARAQEELTKAQDELTKAQTELEKAETDLQTAESELENAETDLKTKENELKAAETTLEQSQQVVLLQEQKLEQIRAKGAELQVKIGDLEAKIAIVEQEYNELMQQIQQQEKEQESKEETEEKTQTVNDYMLAAIEAELLNQQSEIETDANSKSGLGKLWDGAKGLFGGGTKGELNQVSEMYEMYNSLKNGADTNAISELYAKVFSETPDIDAIEESIKTQENLKEGNFTLENGQTVDFNDIKNELSSQVSEMSKNFDDSVESQGIFSTIISKVNNFVGIGTTEKMAQSQMEQCEKLVEKLCSPNTTEQEFASYYKSLTGEDLTSESLNELFNGNSKVSNTKAAETAMDYEATQDSALNAVSTTVAGIATATMGPVAGLAVGAAVNVGIKALDAATQKNDKSFIEDIVDYAKTDMLKDALVGGVSGLSGGVANSAGKVVAGKVLQNQVGNVIKNEAGEFLIETAASRITGEIVEGAVDGALGNSLEYIVDSALDEDKEFSFSELAETTLQGAGFGSLTSLGLGEVTRKIFGSNSLSVKAGDDIKIEGGTLINSRTNQSVSFGDEKIILLNGESLNIDNNSSQFLSLDGKKPSINIFTENTNTNSLNVDVDNFSLNSADIIASESVIETDNTFNPKFNAESEQMKDILANDGTLSAIEFIDKSDIFTEAQKNSLKNSVEGLQDYQYNSEIINGFLRRKSDLDKLADFGGFESVVDFAKSGYDDLSRPLTTETVVYRTEIQTKNYNPNKEVGEVFTADGFTSTTLDKNNPAVNTYINSRLKAEAKTDGLEHQVANIEIVIPEGTNVVQSRVMDEVLLKNGSKFEVVGYTPETNTYRWKVVPDNVTTASTIDIVPSKYSGVDKTASLRNGFVYAEDALPESSLLGEKSIFSLFLRKNDDVKIHTKIRDIENAAVGDMVQLPNAKNIGIKLSDGTIEELNISAQTYKRLFPNGNNVNVKQQNIGDCYLVSSIYSMLSNPETSPQVLRCFVENQDGSVSFKLPKGNVEFKLDFNKNMTDYVETTKIVNGSEGVKMIEYTYGLELLDKKAKDLESEILNKISDYENIIEAGKGFDAIYDFNMGNLDLENARKLVDELPLGGYGKIGDFYPEYREGFYSKFITDTEDGISINFDNLNIHKEKYQNILNNINAEIEELNKKLNELVLDSNIPQELRDQGGWMDEVFSMFGFEDTARLQMDSGLKLLKDTSSNHKYIFGGSTLGDSDTKFLNKELNIVGRHAYTIKPKTGSNGEVLFEITNPWDTSKHIVINESQLTKYFRRIYYAKIV